MIVLPALPRQATLILLLLLVGSTATSSLIPVMGYFIVEGLHQPPWKIGLYTGLVTPMTLLINRRFGEWLDGSVPVRRLLLASIIAYLAFAGLLAGGITFWILVAIGAPLMALANGASSTTFTFGRLFADQADLDTGRYNALLRMCVSVAWMIGPALSFLVISHLGFRLAFLVSALIGVLWLGLWHVCVPREFSAPRKTTSSAKPLGINWPLLLAALVCIFFALGNVLFTSALPIFTIREVGLPGFAPGLSLSVKCLVEIFAIFAAARAAERLGARPVLGAAAVLCLCTYSLYSQVSSVGELVIFAALEGLYYGTFAGIGITFVQSFLPGRPGRATAVFMNSLFFGGMIGSVSTGLIAQVFDFRTVVLVAAGSGLCALTVLVLARGKGPPPA